MLARPLKYAIWLFLGIFFITFISNLLIAFAPINAAAAQSKVLWAIFLSSLAGIFITGLIVFTAPVVTDILATYRRLLRLESLSHPLLVRLSIEAPGTYHHSIMLSTLCYKAAKAIGADPLLARVGAYYHDIGKLKNPSFYIENQPDDANPHDQLSPEESLAIIKEHVSFGDSLAKEHHLPEEIRAFIREHQGTSLISFFYNKAKRLEKEGNKKSVRKSDYRYSGPKPQSKETAILLLADAVEAKVRALPEVSEETITNVVSETIEDRQAENQLSDSTLTEAEIGKIEISFIETLAAMYHKRIDYKKHDQGTKRDFADFGL